MFACISNIINIILQAQYLICEKLREEGFASGIIDIRLNVEIMVPSSQVGVKELHFLCFVSDLFGY